MLFEIRLAIRRLRARPGFTVTAILSLAFGIGATTIFFSLLHSTLLKPLPVKNPSELVAPVDPRFTAPVISYPNILDLQKRSSDFFTGLAAYRILPLSVSLSPGDNSRIWGYGVSGNYFELLGVSAAHGRTLTPQDDVKRGAHPYVVITDAAWKRRFGKDPQVIGREIKINKHKFTIVGITPPGFAGTERFFAPEIFAGSAMINQLEPGQSYLDRRDSQNTFTIARLRPGVSMAQAQAQLDAVTSELGKEYPKENEGIRLKLVEPGWAGDFLRGSVIGFNTILMALAGALLLVVCVNLASLLLAQASERRKETAIRLAIGATRGQLIRQLLFESLALAAAGGSLGMLIAIWGVDSISRFSPPVDFAVANEIAIDWQVAVFAAATTILSSLLFGLVPAMQSTNADLGAAMKNDVSDSRQRRWPLRDLLVGGQIALSVVLLACSGLMLRSLGNAMTLKLGFQPESAATLGFDLATQGYDDAKALQFQKEVLRRVREMPDIAAVATAGPLPLDLGFSNDTVWETGQPVPPASKMPTAQEYFASPDYFKAMGTRLVSGREFDARDEEGRPRVLIVNQEFTRRILNLKDPALAVGKRVEVGGTMTHEIIAVAEDGKYVGLSEMPRPVMFRCNQQAVHPYTRLVWRSAPGVNIASTLSRVRANVLDLDRELTVFSAETMEQHMNLPMLPARFAASAMSAFGLVTMLLAAVGIYGVTAFAVSRRTREIGIRMAIGAAPEEIARMILGKSGVLIVCSALAGTALALAAASLLTPILIGVHPQDWGTHSLGLIVMVVIAIAACLGPARKAAKMDPSISLRAD
jgi:predicted permease